MSDTLEKARKFLLETVQRPGQTRVLAAVSGGMDSMCLLHLLTTWGRQNHFTVTAAHFNHGLRGAEADRDETFVREYCEEKGIPFVSGRGDTRARAALAHETQEEAARGLRYAFLAEQRERLDCQWILTAHHADDNAETMLLNLIRGTASAGLSGIPAVRDRVARPLLECTRGEIASYAAQNAIPHVEDETNAQDDASRNVLRHKIFPVLKELNPRAVENMTRAGKLLAEENAALDDWTFQLLRSARFAPESAELPLGKLTEVPRTVQARAVLRICERVSGHRQDLTAAHVEAALHLLKPDQEGRAVSLPYGMVARNTGKKLSVALKPALPQVSAEMGIPVRFGSWTVTISSGSLGEFCYELSAAVLKTSLSVTAWQPTDRLRLLDARGRRSLKRLCTDAGISPWVRDTLPVLRADGEAVAVPGIGIDSHYAPSPGGETVWVQYQNQQAEENNDGK
ncbi:MAG: tRNA lysidine(34) synthetase TilS [Oscillibacter sp.]|jgi:tRNA(Ile)-lysidine synthase|nr:tRNA lysidine(34) synthetase TilS [Oscillibacter sp.]